MMARGEHVYAYPFTGYWQDVGTVHSYWETHMELLGDRPAFDLYHPSWVIHTRSEERPPAHIGSGAQIVSSLISHGCIIKGQVEHSVLSPGVVVEEGAVVRDSSCSLTPLSVLAALLTERSWIKRSSLASTARLAMAMI